MVGIEHCGRQKRVVQRALALENVARCLGEPVGIEHEKRTRRQRHDGLRPARPKVFRAHAQRKILGV